MEKYIMEIYKLEKLKGHANISNIARSLDSSMSAASKMVVKLKDSGFVHFQRYGKVSLTEKGLETGQQLVYIHQILMRFFQLIGVKEEHIQQEVKNIEVCISLEIAKKIEDLLVRTDS
jgi:DtxR family transcriptional regulator, Mn-dependent transcriptional regulator